MSNSPPYDSEMNYVREKMMQLPREGREQLMHVANLLAAAYDEKGEKTLSNSPCIVYNFKTREIVARPIRILIVDDEEQIRISLKDLIVNAGILECQVSLADRGASAVNILGENEMDLLFVDIGLPDMSGLDVVRFAISVRPGTVCYIVTGRDDVRNILEAGRLCVRDYILKPFEPERILGIIESIQK